MLFNIRFWYSETKISDICSILVKLDWFKIMLSFCLASSLKLIPIHLQWNFCSFKLIKSSHYFLNFLVLYYFGIYLQL